MSGTVPNFPVVAPPAGGEVHEMSSWRPDVVGIAYHADTESVSEIEGVCWVGLRDAWKCLPKRDFDAAVHAAMWVYWNQTMRYCPKCGSPLTLADQVTKCCAACGKDYYPQISPAVIVRVNRGDTTLLARAALRPKFFGLVSGFVEGGETFEECVRRELREEVGIEITNLKYYGSQAWPFPSGIMVGYTADYQSGEIALRDGELLEAGFFTREQVRTMNIPKPFSISRHLIDDWLTNG